MPVACFALMEFPGVPARRLVRAMVFCEGEDVFEDAARRDSFLGLVPPHLLPLVDSGVRRKYNVTVVGVPKDITLTYRTVEYAAPRHLLVVARSRVFTSEDRIAVTPDGDGDGSIVEYDAQLRFNGVLGAADLALRPFFNRIADRAAKGLCVALEGTKV